jgi:hypothetical protein
LVVAREFLVARGVTFLHRVPHGVAGRHAQGLDDPAWLRAFADRVPVRAVLACQAMRYRASLLTAARAGGLMCMMWTAGACTHASANLPVDSPKLMQYQPPDIDELTGIDSDDDQDAHAGSATTPHK